MMPDYRSFSLTRNLGGEPVILEAWGSGCWARETNLADVYLFRWTTNIVASTSNL